jgi:trimethylamine---corrinoid protein Co-methyltransferase
MTSRVSSITPSRRWEVLSAAQLDRLREAIFTVLAQGGVRFPLEAALDTLEAHGAAVDRVTQIARLPRGLVESALAAAPREFTLCGREPACDLPLDGRHCYLSNDASGVFVIDPASGARRASTLADVAASARFTDALPEVAFAWGPIVAAGDMPVA